jgi:CopA family copper-resistance protein
MGCNLALASIKMPLLRGPVGLNSLFGLMIFILLTPRPIRATIREYDLTIARQRINITGRSVTAMTLNGGIPGPTLFFKEGDLARIHVHNQMGVETSIHWHGILVPPNMDGVPFVSFSPIKPGATFTYQFPVRQSGTYWYHSHTSLQEQSGLYGAIVIEPIRKRANPDHDVVLLFSDWTDEDPQEVNRTLKRGSEWYAIEKGSGQSILGAARLGMLGDYFKRELQRMPAMDLADVAYDRFLVNGQPDLNLAVEPKETVRLRIIDGSSTTYFHLEFAGGPMTIIAADGQDVKPIEENRFLIGVAEVYDILVKVPSSGAYEFRATAHDGSGYTSVWIGSGQRHPAPDVPKPNLYQTMGEFSLKKIFSITPAGAIGMPDNEVEAGRFDQPGAMGMGTMDMGHNPPVKQSPGIPGMSMENHSQESEMKEGRPNPETPMNYRGPSMEEIHSGPRAEGADLARGRSGKKYDGDWRFLAADASHAENLAVDGQDPSRPWPPYPRLRSTKPTAFPKDKPIRIIRLTLDGDMERYVWFINNKPLSESDSIRIRKGEVVRFIMINRTMMHHPMHLHGHLFRILNGQGDYAPLKHTVDVAPMSTTVIEFEADEFGDWFFHCHLLYHMKNGMAGVVHYAGFSLDPQLAAVRPDLYRDSWYFWGQADVLSNMTMGSLLLSNTRNILTAEWEVGWQNVSETGWEGLFTWDRAINRFFNLFVGSDLIKDRDNQSAARVVLGLRYLLPFNLESRGWLDSDGGARVNLQKSFRLTPRLTLLGEARYDTHDLWEGRVGLFYLVNKSISLVGQWHSDYGFGSGLQIRF